MSANFFFYRQPPPSFENLLLFAVFFFVVSLLAQGIGNYVINWIEKWLTHRKQRVIVDGEISNWKSVLSGIPLGSVLYPILFLIYINAFTSVGSFLRSRVVYSAFFCSYLCSPPASAVAFQLTTWRFLRICFLR